MTTILGASVYEPLRSNKKDKASLRVLRCSLDGCPLLKRYQCIEIRLGCPYGKITRTDGFTRRAAGFSEKVKEFYARQSEYGPMPKTAVKRMAVVGKYVWLPYSYMSMCKDVPFLDHSGPFSRGYPFVPTTSFTANTVVTLAKFQPRALVGSVIQEYQEKSLPVFLFHLRQEMPDLYDQAAAIDKVVVNRTFTLDSLGGTAVVDVHDVSPGTAVMLRKKWCGIWDGNEIVFETRADASHIIGIHDSEVITLSLCLVPSHCVKVVIEDENEISRLYGEGKIII